jgi:hypothetical protein
VATLPVRSTHTGAAVIPALNTVEVAATLPVRGVTSILSSTLLAAISKLIVAGVTSDPGRVAPGRSWGSQPGCRGDLPGPVERLGLDPLDLPTPHHDPGPVRIGGGRSALPCLMRKLHRRSTLSDP